MSRPQSKNKPNTQSTLRRWHRWVGYSSLILVFILSITGVILNRTEKLNLNRITIQNSLITGLYGQSPEHPALHFHTGQGWISWLEGRLYLDGKLIGQNTAQPVGGVAMGQVIAVASKNRLSLYLPDGSLVEELESSSLPGQIIVIGKTETNDLIIESNRGKFMAQDDLTSWHALPDMKFSFRSEQTMAPENISQNILQDFQGQGITLYRLMLDLHSGRIFGSFGPYMMDLAAISLLFLGITGLMKRKRNSKDRRRRNGNKK